MTFATYEFFWKTFFEEIFLSSSYANTLTRKLASFKLFMSTNADAEKNKIKDTEIEISIDIEKTKNEKVRWKEKEIPKH